MMVRRIMQSQESQADTSAVPKGFKVTVYIRDVVEEFRRLFKALQDNSIKNQQTINIENLLKADSTEQALKEQSILEDAEITFISALAIAERDFSRVSKASTEHQEGEELSIKRIYDKST
jgi:hypothetical protein